MCTFGPKFYCSLLNYFHFKVKQNVLSLQSLFTVECILSVKETVCVIFSVTVLHVIFTCLNNRSGNESF
jgi:hypothetical protein